MGFVYSMYCTEVLYSAFLCYCYSLLSSAIFSFTLLYLATLYSLLSPLPILLPSPCNYLHCFFTLLPLSFLYCISESCALTPFLYSPFLPLSSSPSPLSLSFPIFVPV